ncbi:MAG: hypothetical protein U1E05_01990, partial [Patescibacteria group bacterium]|nr:hypothetical protein [Patescibacteria group bacterium]
MWKPTVLQSRRVRTLPWLATLWGLLLASSAFGQHGAMPGTFDPSQPPSLIFKVTGLQHRLEMTVNTSRRVE